MALDPSIVLGLRQPEAPNQLNMLAQALQIQGLQRQNQLGQMQLRESEAAAAEKQALRNYLSGGANLDTPEGERGLYGVAPTQAGGILKGRLDLNKTRADTKKTEAETLVKNIEAQNKAADQFKSMWAQVRTPEQAAQLNAQGYSHPILGPALQQFGTVEQANSAIPRDPAQFPQYLQQQILGADEFIKRNTLTLAEKTTRDETQRHNKASESAQWANVNIAKERLKLDQTSPKGVIDPERGLLVDPRTGEGRPITLNGNPVGMKPDAATKKELTSLNQQDAIIQGAIDAVKKTPSAFTFKRGLATMAGPLSESAVGRLDSKEEQAARAYVFNNVSKVINERAGAAQSAQELARLRGFLPAETDSPEQVVTKLEAFQTYVADMRSGTTPNAQKPASPTPGMVQDGYRFKGGNPADPNSWEKQ